MANRSNRRRESLSRAMAFEAAIAISPRRADAHHGQEAQPSTHRSDIRAQSHLGARRVIRSCYPRTPALIPTSNPTTPGGRSIHRRAGCDELSTAGRPSTCQRGAAAGRPWITLRLTLGQPPQCPKSWLHSLAYREESIYALPDTSMWEAPDLAIPHAGVR